MYFEVSGKKESKLLQKRLIDLGYRWNTKVKSDRNRGFMTIPRNLNHKYLYVTINGIINTAHSNCEIWLPSYYTKTSTLDLFTGVFIRRHFPDVL